MKRGNKYMIHIFFLLIYIIFGVLIVFAIKTGFSLHDSWICGGVSYSEKGVSQEAIDFCSDIGMYHPGTPPKSSIVSLFYFIWIALLFSIIAISLVAITLSGMKHYKILRVK